MDKLIPDMYQKSIYHINYEKLKDSGIKCLLFDLDNTCVPTKEKNPNKKLIEKFEKLKDLGFKIIIFSNAGRKRLEPFKKALDVDCSYSSRKPLSGKFNKIIKKFGYDLSETAIIGDQLFTDILGGNKVGIKTILINPMSSYDLPITKISRMLERNIMKKMEKKGILTKGKYYE